MDELFITTVGHAVSGTMFVALGIFVVSRDPRRLLYWLFAGFAVLAGTFGIFLAIGINLEPSPLAYVIWMFNLGDYFLIAFFFHFTLRLTHREEIYRYAIPFSYAIATFGTVASLIFPQLFLPEIVPKMFAKSYLTAGPLYTLMITYFFTALLVAGYELVRGYWLYVAERKRYEYFMIALLIGYGLGPWDFALVYDLQISPIFGMLYGFYSVPIAYGIVSEQLLDIRFVVRRAAIYAVGIALSAGTLIALTLLNEYLVAAYPWLQFWTIPAISAVAAFVLARAYWVQAAEADRVKYEFITVAAHKLRTPLTRIRWVLDALEGSSDLEQYRAGMNHVAHSNSELIEITNVLLEAAHTENTSYQYKWQSVAVRELIEAVIARQKKTATQKRHTITLLPGPETMVTGDSARLTSVLDVLIDNAVTYTPTGGVITLTVMKEGSYVRISVADTGMGISPENISHLFSRFFRAQRARLADTEGLGLGLFMAKNITERHGGAMGVSSPGEGKGSTFWFTLPLRR